MRSVKVPFQAFKNAAAMSKMRRSLKGENGHIAKKTAIDFHPNFLVVDGPFKSQVLDVKCGFRERIAVNGLQLSVTMNDLPEADFIELVVDKKANKLTLISDGQQVTILGAK